MKVYPAMSPDLDVITIGRASVDLYGQQIGSRLEDMASFSKAVGGCPANIAIGTARLGLKSGIITRVGNEHFGRFIREQMVREGVAIDGVRTDQDRFTALAILGVKNRDSFPLLFYRTDCADAALNEDDIDPAFIQRAKAIVVTGTHFARPEAAAAQRKAMKLIREAGGRIAFDVDYRPNLWGLAGIGDGEARYVRSENVTAHLQDILPDCDLIVGTEEELHIAGGSEDTLEAIRNIRAVSDGTIVCKRGPMGCVVFDGAIPDSLEKGISGPGFPVEVYNTLGAGDAFMSGFLRGWLKDEALPECCRYANACGAFAVSRLLCSSEIPTWKELQYFLSYGSTSKVLRYDDALNHLHWVTTRREQVFPIMALACDHRLQLEDMALATGAPFSKISHFKILAIEAAARVAKGRDGFGVFMDGRYGQDALFRAAEEGLWTARPVEKTGSRPLDFEGQGSLGTSLIEWPKDQVIKCLCFYHPDDSDDLKLRQERELRRVYEACRLQGRELLLEIIAGKHGELKVDTVSRALERLYDIGIQPDWWKLESQPSEAAWKNIGDVIEKRDPFCRGILLLGLDAPVADLEEAFRKTTATPWVKGFAIGRTIFGDPARAWLAGKLSDSEARDELVRRFEHFVAAWQSRGRPLPHQSAA
ncbi:5-dehydro-2-deoxygluconokinase [Gluconobacter cerinus]|uniref:bifunctional 5-dehydro-2-deoxygluconokinase/5-dehydro-2- deoxyphosphogluconate aldolase n=1 Tax=Gluconobacter cerinus TaxID=38307 RepID=UPI001B8B8A65|nr:5-dehydro-2-deoxygluconokinase [Gluconobacter cerinus]MBS1040392.1 5-dehydro-2-deoxygluconokinase [Gluconobacter cerinus]MBS1046641.1 5-dehydro-2-deoxygluconokinase [Gluconobacter cerinus]